MVMFPGVDPVMASHCPLFGVGEEMYWDRGAPAEKSCWKIVPRFVPPENVAVTVPLVAPLQVTSVLERLRLIVGGEATVTVEAALEHPFASFTTTEWRPGARPVNVLGDVVAVIVPSFALLQVRLVFVVDSEIAVGAVAMVTDCGVAAQAVLLASRTLTVWDPEATFVKVCGDVNVVGVPASSQVWSVPEPPE